MPKTASPRPFMKIPKTLKSQLSKAKNAPASKYSTAKVTAGNVGEKGLPRAAASRIGARAIPVVGNAIMVGTAAYAAGTMLNNKFDLSTKINDYSDAVTGRTKKSKDSMRTVVSTGPKTRKTRKTPNAAPAVTTPSSSASATATPSKKASTQKPQTKIVHNPIKRASPTVSVSDVATSVSPSKSSGITPKKRNLSIGGLVGRTGGKWHLGKKVGKG
jgi:hypothetical protein